MKSIKDKQVKEPKTYQEQIDKLKSKNIIIENNDFALEILKKINYYRFSAYMLSYKNQNDCYNVVSFEEVYNLYIFDMKLRNLLLPILENIEITFRTHISYCLAHTYEALGYLDSKNFKNKEYHKKMKETFLFEIDRSDEIFVAHHKEHYGGNFPIWVLIEIISFGTLSKLFNNLQDHDKDNIGYEHYKVKGEYLRTWLHSLSNIRNKCAHYGRLYNTSLTITPKLF